MGVSKNNTGREWLLNAAVQPAHYAVDDIAVKRYALVMNKLTVEECRALLGESASGHSDEKVERLRDSLENIASVMYDEIAQHAQNDPEKVRWFAYAFENPEDACCSDIPDEAFPDDGPNTLDISDEQVQ
jgi:hypothetical protein